MEINGTSCKVYDVNDGDPADGITCLECEDGKYWDQDLAFGFGDCDSK